MNGKIGLWIDTVMKPTNAYKHLKHIIIIIIIIIKNWFVKSAPSSLIPGWQSVAVGQVDRPTDTKQVLYKVRQF